MERYSPMSNMYPNVNVQAPTMQQPAMQQPAMQQPAMQQPIYANKPLMPIHYYPTPNMQMPMYTSPIHLHSTYEQINICAPPVHKKRRKPLVDTAIILVLYILLVIILRGTC